MEQMAIVLMGGFIILALVIYAVVSAKVARHFTTARRQIPHAERGFEKFPYQRVMFNPRHESLQLFGWYFPSNLGRVIILVHPKDACRGQEFKVSSFPLVTSLLEHGFSVFMLDMRGHGTSDAKYMTYGKHERNDVLGAVDWLMAQGYSAGSIGVLGASMGAVSAIGAASDELAIGAVIADSAFADFSKVMATQFTKQSRLPRFFLPGALAIAHHQTGVDLSRFRPADDIAWLMSRPVLIIHSQDDPFISVDHAHHLAKVGMAELWITPGARHLASFQAYPEAYIEKVIAFFNNYLQPPMELFLKIEPYTVTVPQEITYGQRSNHHVTQFDHMLYSSTTINN